MCQGRTEQLLRSYHRLLSLPPSFLTTVAAPVQIFNQNSCKLTNKKLTNGNVSVHPLLTLQDLSLAKPGGLSKGRSIRVLSPYYIYNKTSHLNLTFRSSSAHAGIVKHFEVSKNCYITQRLSWTFTARHHRLEMGKHICEHRKCRSQL